MASFGSVQPVQYVPSTYGSLSATPESVMPVAIVPGSGIYARPSARPSQSVPLPPNTPNRWDLPNYNSRASRKDDTAIAALSVLLAGGGLAAGVFLLSRRKGADHPVPATDADLRAQRGPPAATADARRAAAARAPAVHAAETGTGYAARAAGEAGEACALAVFAAVGG